jgi:hypothetical protein
MREDAELEKYPHAGTISFRVPDPYFESRMWTV